MRDLLQQEGGERRLWATIFSTSFQQSPEQDSLARSRFRSRSLRRVYTYAAAELFKNSAASSSVAAEFGKA